MPEPLSVGIVGCGKISGAYLSTLTKVPSVRVVAAADREPARSARVSADHPGIRDRTVSELLADDDVDLVLNLTIPAAHGEIAQAALGAGKHVYGEKPLAARGSEADAMVALAAAAGLRIGCAPDTVLGTGTQTARAAVDAGAIGIPIAATAVMANAGPESWHPDPEFYFQPGGGPLLDMGPYYLSALVHLLGPVVRVSGAAAHHRMQRVIGSGPRAGTIFDVEIDTHVTGVLEHEAGALSTLVMSFDTYATRLPRIEVHGTEGSLSVPDPNRFDGEVELWRPAEREWRLLPPSAGYVGAGRGCGVADLATALSAGEPHRASVELARHVLDVMESLLHAAASGTNVTVRTRCDRPAPVPATPMIAAT
ncbi:MAG: Gfo/Idh/MocA family oxidoreductase [Candidatus Dormiibacterota bacterium]